MRVIAGLTLVPMGVGLSLSEYIAAVERVLDEAGLDHTLHATGTNIQGDFDTVTAAVKACHEKIHAMGAARIHTQLTLSTRTDRDQTMAERVESVTSKLG